jgi:hypothetical protein
VYSIWGLNFFFNVVETVDRLLDCLSSLIRIFCNLKCLVQNEEKIQRMMPRFNNQNKVQAPLWEVLEWNEQQNDIGRSKRRCAIFTEQQFYEPKSDLIKIKISKLALKSFENDFSSFLISIKIQTRMPRLKSQKKLQVPLWNVFDWNEQQTNSDRKRHF